jgi:hypothetical protein
MTELDQEEQLALERFVAYLEEENRQPQALWDRDRVMRSPDGQIIVVAELASVEPSATLGMIMAHKADQLYKQTGCRFLLAQQPEQDPKKQVYIWSDGRFSLLV